MSQDEGPYSLWTAPLICETSPWDISLEDLDRALERYEELYGGREPELDWDAFRTPVTMDTLLAMSD